MRKKKVFATAAIAALAAAQMAMPVMAAKTNNSQEKLDKDPAYTQDELRQNGHTLFSVFESATDVSNQVSYTVPLYVTMAAVQGKSEMSVPDTYYIQNTCADPNKTPIGISGMTVDTFGQWEIVEKSTALTKDKADDKYKMTFSLGNQGADGKITTGTEVDFPTLKKNDKKTLFDKGTWKTYFTGQENFIYSDAKTYGAPGLKPITGKLEIAMKSTIAEFAKRDDSKTVPAFKVTYTLSALDEKGQPKASTYVGDDYNQATAEVVGVN